MAKHPIGCCQWIQFIRTRKVSHLNSLLVYCLGLVNKQMVFKPLYSLNDEVDKRIYATTKRLKCIIH